MEFLAFGFSLAHPWLLWYLGVNKQYGKSLSLFISTATAYNGMDIVGERGIYRGENKKWERQCNSEWLEGNPFLFAKEEVDL